VSGGGKKGPLDVTVVPLFAVEDRSFDAMLKSILNNRAKMNNWKEVSVQNNTWDIFLL